MPYTLTGHRAGGIIQQQGSSQSWSAGSVQAADTNGLFKSWVKPNDARVRAPDQRWRDIIAAVRRSSGYRALEHAFAPDALSFDPAAAI